MCGICGFISDINKDEKTERIQAMMDTLVHRGPDDASHYINENIGMGFRRLSIIDLQGGRQPMSNEDNSIWIVFNGEIYNFLELREVLIKRSHIFKTKSDTEVIIHAYEEWGPECVKKLRGMFAFAIWDSRDKTSLLWSRS